jgi:hypothetical protein
MGEDKRKRIGWQIPDNLRDHAKSSFISTKMMGIEVMLEEFYINTEGLSLFLVASCKKEDQLNIFIPFVTNICELIDTPHPEILGSVKTAIAKWRNFWAVSSESILSEENQIGLLGELIVLEQLYLKGIKEAFKYWVGYKGREIDFEFPNVLLEVKASKSNSRTHRVNGLNQLSDRQKTNLYIVSILADNIDTRYQTSVNLKVNDLEAIIYKMDPDKIDHFFKAISLVGYTPIHAEKYTKFYINLDEIQAYLVTSSFPRLTSNMIASQMSNRVSRVSYNITLEGLPHISIKNILKEVSDKI